MQIHDCSSHCLAPLVKQIAVLAIFCSCLYLFPSIATAKPNNIVNFCYENKELLPHYRENSAQVPMTMPGAAIELLQVLDARLPSVTVNYHRQPWSRCLHDLKLGKVDAIISSYKVERESLGVFPKSNGVVDKSKAFSRIASCLIQHKASGITWDGTAFQFSKLPVIAIPRNYKIIDFFTKHGFSVYKTNSPQEASQLVYNHRVDATTVGCTQQQHPKDIEFLPVPVKVDLGFLLFSHQFYQKNNQLVESIWQHVGQLDHTRYYDKYANY